VIPLSELHRCFSGVMPAIISTCSCDGIPNATFLSQVFQVGERHVALSRQFFNKTSRNIAENPYAHVELIDPISLKIYDVDLRFERSETSGELFESLAKRIQAIASQTGMSGIFRLLSADVFEVLDVREVQGVLDPPALDASAEQAPASLRTELRALSVVTERLRRARDLDELLSLLLDALHGELGFGHTMLLLPDESGKRLFTVASRGYGEDGIGAEVAMGEGLIGTVAESGKSMRMANIGGQLRYARAVGRAADPASQQAKMEIPLPGLPDVQSQLAIPLLAQGRLAGVLAVESRSPVAFEEWHETFLEVIGHQVAGSIETMMLRAEAEEAQSVVRLLPVPAAVPSPEPRILRFCFYRNDDCVFVGDDYLIRNVPGRILWKILRSYVDSSRTDFSNRELRLDPSLGLPPIKDNLESRLILLRKRLEQKCPQLRLVPKCRGQFRFETSCKLELIEKDSA
jgi:adenylate cyclase